jgi:hypothetical protein
MYDCLGWFSGKVIVGLAQAFANVVGSRFLSVAFFAIVG